MVKPKNNQNSPIIQPFFTCKILIMTTVPIRRAADTGLSLFLRQSQKLPTVDCGLRTSN